MPARRSGLVALLLLVLVAAGCGSGPTGDGSGDYGDGLLDGTAETAPTPASEDHAAGGGSSSSATSPSPAGGGAAPSPAGGPSNNAGPATTAGGADSATRAAMGPPGAFAPVVLGHNGPGRVVIEVMQQDGADPRSRSIEHSVSRLSQVSGKPVSVTGPVSVPGAGRQWSAKELRETADALTSQQQGGDQAVIRLLYVHGTFGDNDSVLGVAVRGDVAAFFVDRIHRAETPLVSRGSIEDAVTLHEIGHLLGLVDLYLDTGRADPEHPGHSSNRSSVMYWAVESSLVSQVLGGPPPREFDDADRRDLAAIREAS